MLNVNTSNSQHAKVQHACEPLQAASLERMRSALEAAVRAHTLSPIEAGVPVSILSVDYWPSIEGFFREDQLAFRSANYNKLHFDFLLMSSSNLLARIIVDRQSYDNLRQQCSELMLRTYQLARLEEIHAEEVSSGWYLIDYEQASARATAQSANLDDVSARQLHINEHMNRKYGSPIGEATCRQAYENVEQMARSSEKAANAGMISPYPQIGQKPDEKIHPITFGWGSTWIEDQPYMIRELVGLYTYVEAFLRSSHQKALASIAEDNAKHSHAAITALSTAATRQACWEAVSVDFRRKRSELSTLLAGCLEYFRGAGGPMALEDQIDCIRERVGRDLADAFVRLEAAAKGIGALFESASHVPNFPSVADLPNLRSTIDTLNQWVQSATYYLSVRMRQEQQFSVSVSVRKLLNDDEWSAANNIYTSGGGFALSFFIDKDHFSNLRAVRMIGIGVSVESVGQLPKGIWQGVISPPAAGIYVRDDGNEVDFDQPAACVPLGGLRSREYTGLTLAGSSYIENYSPISRPAAGGNRTRGSDWRVTLQLASHTAERFPIDDICLDIYAFGRYTAPEVPSPYS